jgi:hypothetical protein
VVFLASVTAAKPPIAEKALVNLPSPLTAEDELLFPGAGRHERVKLIAGVHRQTWVSGTAVFVDVHISNSTQKPVKKLQLQLEKATTFYDHAPPSTATELAAHLRLPCRTEKEIVTRWTAKKARRGWHGVPAMSQDERTCRLDLPRGLVTIGTGMILHPA